ncbi:MAG TPA: DNRLRE domain-containing protein [Candidatus Bathyarchaeia archaeon]|nr:DNRLRE domain-containing protein [Candidatus Bathyarchaeia archaeon]
MPVITLSPTNSVLKDTFAYAVNPAGNYATDGSLYVGADNSGAYRSFLKFDFGLIPNNAIINSATLTLVQTGSSIPAITVEVHKITGDWVDTSVTWNAQPSFDSAIVASLYHSGSSTRQFDVKSLVQDWVNGVAPNYGFLLKGLSEALNAGFLTYGSANNGTVSNRPSLVIDYTIPTTGKKQVEYVGIGGAVEGSSVTSIQVPLPTGASAGDLLVVQLTPGAQPNELAGWTKYYVSSGSVTSVFYKFMTAGEVAPTFTFPTASFALARMSAFRNVKSVLSLNSTVFTSVTSIYPPQYTASLDDTMFVILNSINSNGTAATPPLGYQEIYDFPAGSFSRALQASYHYMHANRTQTTAEMTSTLGAAATSTSSLMVLEPKTNNPPTITLSSPADNQVLVEGNTYQITGTATDTNNGDVVTVKFKIDNGTSYNITAAVSDGTTPLNFSKTLTYLNNRLYDGETAITPILDDQVTHTLTVWAEDDKAGKGPDTTRNFTVLYNQPPQISGTDRDLGTLTTPPSIQYDVTDAEGYSFTITEAVDGNTIRAFPGVDGQQETLTISNDLWITLQPDVEHKITITATDQYNATSTRTITFKRAVDGIELATTSILPADAQPTRIILSLNATIPESANLNVQVCNNAHDPSPTWEDMTQSVINGRPYVFTNTTSTSGQWGIQFKISILPGA